MSEFTVRARRLMLPGILTGAAILAGCGETPQPAKKVVPSKIGTAPAPRTDNELRVGDKVTKVPLLEPAGANNKTYTLTPSQNAKHETLGLIYVQQESQIIVSVLRKSVRHDSSGFLLTAEAGKIGLSAVLFDSKSKKIDYITPPAGFLQEDVSNPLFVLPESNPRDDLTVSVTPMSTGSQEVQVDFRRGVPNLQPAHPVT